MKSLVVAEKLKVGTTAFEAVWKRLVSAVSGYSAPGTLTLKLDLVLDNESLALVVDGLGELGRDGVVSSSVLDNKTLVALNALEDGGFFNGPLADVGPLLVLLLAIRLLLGVRGLPAGLPVIGELFKEVGLDGGRLQARKASASLSSTRTWRRSRECAGVRGNRGVATYGESGDLGGDRGRLSVLGLLSMDIASKESGGRNRGNSVELHL